jgi:hypothetical protein
MTDYRREHGRGIYEIRPEIRPETMMRCMASAAE